jgi:hypothetical protein
VNVYVRGGAVNTDTELSSAHTPITLTEFPSKPNSNHNGQF